MVQTSIKPIALEDFLKLPETKLASEFIDGCIISKPIPQGKHIPEFARSLQLTIGELFSWLDD